MNANTNKRIIFTKNAIAINQSQKVMKVSLTVPTPSPAAAVIFPTCAW